MTLVRVVAPAKINLTLHVTGQREDGYHLLDSLVAFAPAGDTLLMRPTGVSSITVEGPEALGVPTDVDNLALRAAMLTLAGAGAALTLDKHLPAASGIGGGSSDAAAAFRGALLMMDAPKRDLLALGPEILSETRFRPLRDLGADVPMCLLPKPLRARGIGDRIDFVELPPLPAVLVNPRVAVSTPAVFRALKERANPPMPDALPKLADAPALIAWLAGQRNDMEGAARGIAPEIGAVLDALAATPGCGLARMSGSGATCFGLFADEAHAREAAKALGDAHPNWWVAGGVLGDQTERAMPRHLPQR
ncbi:MAG: 4-(cytidine 5'-diphospho)-2-C-methyl-D-erythritol kinase [Pseudomonadota bacterium]